MPVLDEFKKNAEQCSRMAENMRDPYKKSWLLLAETWRKLAQAEAVRPEGWVKQDEFVNRDRYRRAG